MWADVPSACEWATLSLFHPSMGMGCGEDLYFTELMASGRGQGRSLRALARVNGRRPLSSACGPDPSRALLDDVRQFMREQFSTFGGMRRVLPRIKDDVWPNGVRQRAQDLG